MKKLFAALLIVAGLGANAASYITVTNTFTNRTVVGDSFTVNGTTVRFTNAPLNNTAWLPTNSAAASATNVQRWFGRTQPALYARLVNATNTAISGTDLIYTISGGFGYLTTNTAGTTNQYVVEYPWQNLPTAKKTNQADALIEGIGTYGHTNAFPANSQALTNFVGITNAQTLTRKTLTTPTITGPTVSAMTNWGGILSNMTQIQVTNLDAQAAQISGGSISNVYILNALDMQGIITALTNGTLHGTSVTNAPMLHGTNLTAFGGYLSNIIAHTLTVTNFSSPGSAAGSLQIGEAATAVSDYAIAIGDNSTATNESSVALGYAAESKGGYSIAIGAESSALGYGAVSLGTASANAWGSIAIGSASIAGHSNSAAIGTGSATTTTNQIVLGTSSEKVTIPGRLEGATLTNTLIRGTNVWSGGVIYTPAANAALANGFNSGIVLGTNVWLQLSGPSAAYTNVGFAAEPSGAYHKLSFDNPVSVLAIEDNSGLDATAANRIRTGTGAALVLTNNPAWLEVIYDGGVSRWRVISHSR